MFNKIRSMGYPAIYLLHGSGKKLFVGDFYLPNVDWVYGLLVSPVNSISPHFGIQNDNKDLFTSDFICLWKNILDVKQCEVD